MNIMQYREMKRLEAEKGSQVDQTPPVTPVVQTQTNPVVTTTDQTKPVEVDIPTPTLPEKIAIEGIGEVTLDELKNGYLRQSDYTVKTQEVARKKREVQDAVMFYEQVKANPDVLTQIKANIPTPQALDPTQAKVVELEHKLYDFMLDKEITTLQAKYPDFEVKEVLEVADEKGITNLEDAYLIASARKRTSTPTVNESELKERLRVELLKELQADKTATQTIITTNSNTTPITDNTPTLSEGEKKVARMMRLSESDYIKWRDAGKKK